MFGEAAYDILPVALDGDERPLEGVDEPGRCVKPACRYRETIRDVVVLRTVTPVLVRTPRENDSTRSRLAWNSAVPTRPRGALGPVKP
jgi:hypothetical protein